ncbi:hypothetical protein D3C81_1399050 [compost metagenome]
MAHVPGKGHYRAAVTRIVPAFAGQVRFDHGAAGGVLALLIGHPCLPALRGLLESPATGLLRQGFAGFEVPVEAAVGQARSGHHIDHADPVQTAFAEQPRGGIDDGLAVEVGLFAGNAGHGSFSISG